MMLTGGQKLDHPRSASFFTRQKRRESMSIHDLSFAADNRKRP